MKEPLVSNLPYLGVYICVILVSLHINNAYGLPQERRSEKEIEITVKSVLFGFLGIFLVNTLVFKMAMYSRYVFVSWWILATVLLLFERLLIRELIKLLWKKGMCGEGSARNRIRKMAEGLSNILWLPLQPENRLNELLNLADIHVLPQRGDAADLVMPSKLTGMLASGKAIVACAEPQTQVGKVVGKSGVIVPPGDDHALASAINALAGYPERREDLGRKAREYAERFLDYDVIMSGVHEEMMRI